MLPNSEISSYITTREDSDGVVVATANYTAMSALYQYEGLHSLRVIAIDSEGRRSFTTLTMQVIQGEMPEATGPTIVWDGGYSFDETHDINLDGTGTPVVLFMTSQSGFTGLTVDIDSDTLTDAELSGLYLASHMDLVNPATSDMASGLAALSFPTGDQILGQTSLTFDINEFMPTLCSIAPNGSVHKFKLTLSDASGDTVKTLNLKVVK